MGLKHRSIAQRALLMGIALAMVFAFVACPSGKPEPIRVGVLHSLTGTLAFSEVPVKDATLLAIEEINARGGVMGRPIEPIVVDGESDWPLFARSAERLLTEDKVAVVFGCWTSASRKTVKPIFEKHDGLLFYPVQYEGLEQSPNIFYTGAAPNQQIIPAVKWAVDTLGKKRFFLVGSDYVFPRSANAIIRDVSDAIGGEVVGEAYIPLGSTDVQSAIDQIIAAKPDVILNTINGDSNVAFFRALRDAGVQPSDTPTISFSIAEQELATMDAPAMAGDYAAWNYFQSVDTPENKAFVAAYRARHGDDALVTDPMEAAYVGVHLWARAAEDAGALDSEAIRRALADQGFAAPEGLIFVDGETQHLWKVVRIGRIRPDAQFDVVWSSGRAVRPVPYPRTRTREQWREFLDGLFNGWMRNWALPQEAPRS